MSRPPRIGLAFAMLNNLLSSAWCRDNSSLSEHAGAMKARGPASGLTDRQREVLELISRGKTNFEIANALGITLDGAKWHVREIMAKLGCDTREEAVAIWRTRPAATVRLWGRAVESLGFLVTRAGKIAIAASASAAIALGAAILVATVRPDPDVSGAEQAATTSLDSESGGEQPEVVAFRSCGTDRFVPPTIAEMADIFQRARFGGTTDSTSPRPAPPYFAYYLRSVYQIVPRAISANVESVALSGAAHAQNQTTTVLIAPVTPCDEAFRHDRTLNFYEFWLVDMVPKQAHLPSDRPGY
jgi:DNA-binding CsgD family transcriptional regulator